MSENTATVIANCINEISSLRAANARLTAEVAAVKDSAKQFELEVSRLHWSSDNGHDIRLGTPADYEESEPKFAAIWVKLRTALSTPTGQDLLEEVASLREKVIRYNAIAERGWDLAKRFGKWNVLDVSVGFQTGIGHGETLDAAIDDALARSREGVRG